MKASLLFTCFITCLALNLLQAQTWERYYPGSGALEIASHSGDSLTLLACLPDGRAYLHISGSDGQLQSSQEAGLCDPASTFDGGTVSFVNFTAPNNHLDVKITKHNADGDLVWEHVFGDSLDDFGIKILQTRDSGIVLLKGYHWNKWDYSQISLGLIKINKNGIVEWGGSYLGFYAPINFQAGVEESSYNGDLVVYYVTQVSDGHDFSYYSLVNPNGVGKHAGLIDNTTEMAILSAKTTAWGGLSIDYTVSGFSTHQGGGFYTYFSNKTWDDNGGQTLNPRYAAIGIELPDGGTLFCKNSNNNDLLVARVNEAGKILAHIDYTGLATDMIKNAAGEIFIAGKKYGQPIGQTWLMKLDTQAFITDEYIDICEGDYFGSLQITQDTVLTDSFSLAGQDSIVFYHLQVQPVYHVSHQFTLCEGASILFGDNTVSHSGIYVDSLQTAFGCDSIIILNLTVLPTDTVSTTIELCQHEASPLTGIIYDDEGVFAEQLTLTNQFGCDSLVMAEVVVHPEEIIDAEHWVPYGFILNGDTLTESIVTIQHDFTEFGCPRTVYIFWNVSPSATHSIEYIAKLSAQPNPFSALLTIAVELAVPTSLNASIYDALGREISVLANGQRLSQGEQYWEVNTADWPSGVYTLLAQINGQSIARRIIKQ